MLHAPTPHDENQRLAALSRTQLLDSKPDDAFDGLVRTLVQSTGAPIGLISLVDSARQWFFCRVGLDAAETARDISFCGHAIMSREPLIVRNALADARFADNPLVVGPDHLRAYLGMPIVIKNNLAIGTLCAIDVEPRDWTEPNIQVLRELAMIASALIAAHTIKLELQRMLQLKKVRSI